MLCCAWSLSRVQLFATLWTVAHQAPLSMGILLIEYWSELPCPPPGDLPNPKIEPRCPALQVDSLPLLASLDVSGIFKIVNGDFSSYI